MVCETHDRAAVEREAGVDVAAAPNALPFIPLEMHMPADTFDMFGPSE